MPKGTSVAKRLADAYRSPTARIIAWDIETTSLNASFGVMLAFGYKDLRESKPKVLSLMDYARFKRNPIDDRDLVRDAAKVLASADVWVTHYGKRFDVPFVRTRMLRHGMTPVAPTPHVDTWEIARKHLKFSSNRLASIQQFLELPNSKTALTPQVWARAGVGHKPSLRYIVEHCKQDVLVLEQAYLLLRPLLASHPNVGLLTADGQTVRVCSTCGSARVHKAGVRRTRICHYQRYRCNDCGAYSAEGKQSGKVVLR